MLLYHNEAFKTSLNTTADHHATHGFNPTARAPRLEKLELTWRLSWPVQLLKDRPFKSAFYRLCLDSR